MATKSVALVALLTITGCIAKPHTPAQPRIPYTFVIDTGFTEREILVIAQAGADWMRIVDALDIQFVVAPCDSFRTSGVYCIQARHPKEMACAPPVIGCCEGPKQRITLDRWNLTPKYLRYVAGHEMGHAMGLDHDAPRTVMAARETDTVAPTPRDAAQFWRVRKVVAP